MVCPNCKTEYRNGFYICADCNINLVSKLPHVDNPECTLASDEIKFEKVFETGDSYEFLDASNILKNAGVPFTGDEYYTGEFRPTRRAQAPYVWVILVPAEKREEATQLLHEKVLGGPFMVTQAEVEPMKPNLAWLLLSVVAAIAIIIGILVWKL